MWIGHFFGYAFYYAYFTLGTFIGSPLLERETWIRESPVLVHTGKTSVPQEKITRTEKLFFLPENLSLPNFQRKQDDRIIRRKEEKGKEEWEDLPFRTDKSKKQN